MLYITTKLKRCKCLSWLLVIATMPIRFPFMLIQLLGSLSEIVTNYIDKGCFRLREFIVKKLKWDEAAKRQHLINKDKFKYCQISENAD